VHCFPGKKVSDVSVNPCLPYVFSTEKILQAFVSSSTVNIYLLAGWHCMVRKLFPPFLNAFLLFAFITLFCSQTSPNTLALANGKPTLTLNRVQGPLGVTLTLSGTNFPPGTAQLSYMDAQNVPGIFTPPGDTSVQMDADGTFSTANVAMPESGPAGRWQIVVTDSQGLVTTIRYNALAPPGAPTAGSPSISIDPVSGMSGDAITFYGTNWLPRGTIVNIFLQVGLNSIPLLQPSPTSDSIGVINGTFHLPTNLHASQATILAIDTETGALHTQTPILINGASLTPTATVSPTISPTPTSQPTTAPSPTSTRPPISTNSGGPDNSGSSLIKNLNPDVWGPVLLAIGGVLGVAGLMLVLFMLPWGQRKHNNAGRKLY
jgi:hypothetical protein